MKKYKINIFSFILGILLGCVGIVFAYSNIASDTGYTPRDTTWKVDNVQDALDNLHDDISVNTKIYDKKTIVGNVTTTYKFNEEINLGLIIISSSNNSNDSVYYVANINSLSTGKYTLIDDSIVNIGAYTNEAGHRSKIYIINNVKANSTMSINTRYSSILQIIKMK